MPVEPNRAVVENDDMASWREELSLRLVRAFCLVFAVSVVILWITVRGDFARWFMTCLALTATVLLAVPAFTGRPSGKLRAWFLVAPTTAASITSFALVGFLSAAGVILTTTLMLAGLLLGRRVMLWLAVASALVISGIAWGMVSSALKLPDPLDVSMRSPLAWARTMTISFLAIGLFGTMMLAVIRRMESSLLRARSETLRREQAERERAEAQIGALEAKQLETIGRLAAGVAHDFNNNLTAIMGCAELLKLELPSMSSGQNLANDILQASQRAADHASAAGLFAQGADATCADGRAPTD